MQKSSKKNKKIKKNYNKTMLKNICVILRILQSHSLIEKTVRHAGHLSLCSEWLLKYTLQEELCTEQIWHMRQMNH